LAIAVTTGRRVSALAKEDFMRPTSTLVSSLATLALVSMTALSAHAQPKDEKGAAATPAPKADAQPAKANGTPAAAAPATEAVVPVNLRLRSLEQRVQALKERAWRAKARVGMLKEAVLGGGVGARASIVHLNQMGSKFRLLRLVYALDGTQIFSRADETGKLHETKRFDVLSGPIAPGSHTLSVVAIYRGNGYGVFRYYNKYKFTVKSSHAFTVEEGKGTSIKVRGFEKGGATTPLEKRPNIDFKVSVVQGGGKN